MSPKEKVEYLKNLENKFPKTSSDYIEVYGTGDWKKIEKIFEKNPNHLSDWVEKKAKEKGWKLPDRPTA